MRKPPIKNLVIEKNGDWYARLKYTELVENNGIIEQKVREKRKKCVAKTAASVKLAYQTLKDDRAAALKAPTLRPANIPLTFNELADYYESDVLSPAVIVNGVKLSGKVSVKDEINYLRLLRDRWGNKEFAKITFTDIKVLRRDLFALPVVSPVKGIRRARSASNVNHYLKTARQIFNYAVESRWLDRNPFKDGKSLIQPSLEVKRHQRWTADEERRALDLAAKSDRSPHLYPAIIFMCDGFFRPGELFSLKWSDLEAGKLLIMQTKVQRYKEFFLTKRMRTAADEWKRKQKALGLYKPDGLFLGVSSVKTAWKVLMKHIGRPDLHFHDLRHECATKALEAGVPLPYIQKLLGHADIKTTMVYLNISSADIGGAVELMDKMNEKRLGTA